MILRKHHAVLPVIALAGALALAGCNSGNDADDTSGSASETASATSTAAESSTASPTTSSSPTDAAPTAPSSDDGAQAGADSAAPTDTATEEDPSEGDTSESDAQGADPEDAVTETPDASADAQPTTTPPPGAGQGGAVASVENCRAQDLSGSVTPREGAAGSVILDLTLSNNGHQACKLSGYPGVSFADASGTMIGVPAERTGTGGTTVTVLPGESASAALKQSNAGDYGQVCNPHTTTSLVVYPPENEKPLNIPYETQACGNPKITQLEIQGFGA